VIPFVCFLWRGTGFSRPVATYGVQHVAVLARMLERHGGHQLTCIHDGVELPPGVAGVQMPDAVARLPNYLPKLWAWSPELHCQVPRRFACIDLDVVILDDLAPVLETHAPVMIWDSAVGEPYNSSLFTLARGFGHDVWTTMTPERVAEAEARSTRWTGDQSWVAHVLGPHLPTFGEWTGVIRYRRSRHAAAPPPGTRAAFLCGPMAPDTEGKHSPWIARAWN
jgi:hypothetical protein